MDSRLGALAAGSGAGITEGVGKVELGVGRWVVGRRLRSLAEPRDDSVKGGMTV